METDSICMFNILAHEVNGESAEELLEDDVWLLKMFDNKLGPMMRFKRRMRALKVGILRFLLHIIVQIVLELTMAVLY